MSDDPNRDRPDDPAPDWGRQPTPNEGDAERDWTQQPPPPPRQPPPPRHDAPDWGQQAPPRDAQPDWGQSAPPPPPGSGYDQTGGWQDAPPSSGYDPAANYDPAGWNNAPMPGAGRPASVGKRAGAFIIDAIGVGIVAGIVLLVLNIVSGGLIGGYLMTLLAAVAAVAYFALMEAATGQTLAKQLLRIKAVSEDGSPLTTQQAVLRRIPFYIGSVIPTLLGSLVSLGLGIAILVTAAQDEPIHQGLHDKWAKTKVIEV